MNATRLTQRVFLVLVCCLAIVFLPLSAGAQGILEKGAKGVQKGVETGAEKTKEGAEAVGRGTKKVITGEDTSTTTTQEQTTTPSQSTMPSDTTTRSKPMTSSQSTTTESSSTSRSTEQKAGGKKLPKTAGELPLLALIGVLSLAAAGTSRLIRRGRLVK